MMSVQAIGLAFLFVCFVAYVTGMLFMIADKEKQGWIAYRMGVAAAVGAFACIVIYRW